MIALSILQSLSEIRDNSPSHVQNSHIHPPFIQMLLLIIYRENRLLHLWACNFISKSASVILVREWETLKN